MVGLACFQLRREEFENRNAERIVRVADFVAGTLPPFVQVHEDTVAAKARRGVAICGSTFHM